MGPVEQRDKQDVTTMHGGPMLASACSLETPFIIADFTIRTEILV